MKWIPFSEQQPTPGAYLVTDGQLSSIAIKNANGWHGICCGDIEAYRSKHTGYGYDYKIIDSEELTHWMPLPSIPESTK